MIKIALANERLFLRSPAINVCFRIVIAGAVAKSLAERAVAALCLRHPLLNSFVETDSDGTRWLVQRDELLALEYCAAGEMDWRQWYAKADSEPFDFSQGPLVRICIISGAETEIIILGHHVLGDGVGYLNLAKDFVAALNNRLDPAPQLPPFTAEERYFKHTALLDPGVQAYARGLNEEWKKSRVSFSENDYKLFFAGYRSKLSPQFYLASLAGDKLESLVNTARENSLTVNEMIAASFSQAFMETLGAPEIRLGVAANIRNELVSEPNACMGNYVTGIATKTNRDPAKDFKAAAQATAAILREQLAKPQNRHLAVHFLNEFDKDLIESAMYAAYGNFEHPVAKQLASLLGEEKANKGLGISNLGRHNLENCASLQFIGPAFPANLLTVGAITVNGTLNFCLRYNEEELSTETVEKIYNRASQLLL
jgi:NRPS condensation-like uncharacterized protein